MRQIRLQQLLPRHHATLGCGRDDAHFAIRFQRPRTSRAIQVKQLPGRVGTVAVPGATTRSGYKSAGVTDGTVAVPGATRAGLAWIRRDARGCSTSRGGSTPRPAPRPGRLHAQAGSTPRPAPRQGLLHARACSTPRPTPRQAGSTPGPAPRPGRPHTQADSTPRPTPRPGGLHAQGCSITRPPQAISHGRWTPRSAISAHGCGTAPAMFRRRTTGLTLTPRRLT
jgi:hypothetical protein